MPNADQEVNPDPEARGGSLHIQDCRIWAEISYLDSPTEYREFLTVSGTLSRDAQPDVLTVWDTSTHWKMRDLTWPLLSVLAMILLLISCYLLFEADLL
jgi:hypothetical protein